MYLFLHQVNPLILDLPYIGYSSLYLYPCDNFTESSKGLLVWLRNFHSFEDVTSSGEGLQILTYTWHLRPLSSEGSLACHTYCDTGLPFIMVISEIPWHSRLMPSVWQGTVTTCFTDLGLSHLGFDYPTFRLWGEHSNSLRHCRGTKKRFILIKTIFFFSNVWILDSRMHSL